MTTIHPIEDTLQSIQNLSINDTVDFDDDRDNYKDTDARDEDEFDEDEDQNNEFLNSSSFLSNSEIIRSSNVNALKSSTTRATTIPSPTRTELKSDSSDKRKSHFQLFVPLEQNIINSDNSDNEEKDEYEDIDKEIDVEIPKKSNKFRSISSMSRRTSKFIDIDQQDATPKLPRIHPDSTPWRKLRPTSMFLKENISITNQKTDDPISSNFMKSFFDDNPNTINTSPSRAVSMFESTNTPLSEESGSSASSELNNLRKQITNYKVQLRILAEYIRTLLKTSNNFDGLKNELMVKLEKENGFLLNERELLQSALNNKNEPETPYDIENDPKYNSKIQEILELKNDLISTKSKSDQLILENQDLKQKIIDTNTELQFHLSKSTDYENLLNELLSQLLKFLKGESAKAINKAQSGSIETKIRVTMFAINELLEDFEELTFKLNKNSRPLNLPSLSERNLPIDIVSQVKSELESAKVTEDELRKLLRESSETFTALKNGYTSLNKKYKENLAIISKLKKVVNEKQSEINSLNDKILEFETNSIERSDSSSNEKDNALLKNRIQVIKLNHSKEIDILQNEINELKFKENSNRELQSLKNELEKLKDEFYQKSKNYETTVDNLESLLKLNRHDYEILTSDYQALQKSYHNLEDELHVNERDYKRKLDHAAKELNQSVGKQRSIAAEKSKFAFALEDIKRENSKLNLNNNTLLDKVNRLSYQVSNLSEYEIGFKNLHQLSISYLQNLLNHFKNVLEPGSLRQAESKLNKLKDPNLMDLEVIHSLHRSLLSYFENAIVSVMAEYSEMYATRISEHNDEEELNRLKDEINALTEELEWCYSNGQFNEDNENNADQTMSERTKLRLAELEKRRKMEREQRKSEHRTFSARIKTLESENAELRERLKLLER